MGNFCNVIGRDDVDGDLDAIKRKYLLFKVRKIPRSIYSEIEKVDLIFKCYSYSEARKVKLVVIVEGDESVDEEVICA
jgi:hypothetical protein